MKDLLIHEEQFRSFALMKVIKDFPVMVLGAGALGSNIAESLVKAGFENVTVVDFDRIEERNLSTQPYSLSDIGQLKAKILAYRLARDIGVTTPKYIIQRITKANIDRFITNGALLIEVFDNAESRQVVKEYVGQTELNCLHVGLSADGKYSEAVWNENYVVHFDAEPQDEICDYPLSRNLVSITTGLACELIFRFAETGEKSGFQFTFQDFKVTKK